MLAYLPASNEIHRMFYIFMYTPAILGPRRSAANEFLKSRNFGLFACDPSFRLFTRSSRTCQVALKGCSQVSADTLADILAIVLVREADLTGPSRDEVHRLKVAVAARRAECCSSEPL